MNSELYVRSSRCIFGSARFRKRFEVPIPKFLFSRKYRNFRALLKTKSALKTHFQKTKNAPDCNELLKYCEYRFHKHCSKAALCYVLYLLYPYITYSLTFRSLNLHLNSTSKFYVYLQKLLYKKKIMRIIETIYPKQYRKCKHYPYITYMNK